MGKINVLIVGLSPETGGIENFVLQVVSGMDAQRFHFDVLTFCPACAYEKELTQIGCRIFHAARRGKNPVKNYLDQRRFFAQNPNTYDFIWLHLSSASDLKTILLAKRYTKAKIACHCHGTDFESREGIIRKLHLHLHFKNRPKLLKNTDIYLACSKLAGEWLYGNIGGQLTVIPNGIDLSVYTFSNVKRDEIRKKIGIEDKLAVGHVGRLSQQKNQYYLIDIFEEFYKKHKDSVLLIAGSGNLEKDLRKKVSDLSLDDAVFFLGFRADVPDLLHAFDVFLLPSLFEGLPISIVEAQANGLPCVISDKVTNEVAVTGLVSFVSIDGPPVDWVGEIENALAKQRDSDVYCEELSKAGYSSQTKIEMIDDIFGGGE